MTILVTGSAGHLGEALMRSLRSAGRVAIGMDLLPSSFTDVVGSICNRAFVKRGLRGAAELGWRPRYDFRHVLDCLHAGTDFRSPLAREIGSKGYHATVFERGPYPVA